MTTRADAKTHPPTAHALADRAVELTVIEGRARSAQRRRRTLIVRVVQLILVVALFIGWENAPDRGFTRELNVSRPSKIWDALKLWNSQGILFHNIWITLEEAAWGFVVGTLIGLAVGLMLGVNPMLSRIVKPFIMALQAIPRLALMPLFLIWFGIGAAATHMLVVSLVFFLVFNATYSGVIDVDPRQVEAVRMMRGGPIRVLTMVTLPSVVSWLISGLRVTVPYALIGAVTGEILASNAGLGYLMQHAAIQFFTAGVFAGVFVLMVVGVLLDGVVSMLARYLLRWRSDDVRSV